MLITKNITDPRLITNKSGLLAHQDMSIQTSYSTYSTPTLYYDLSGQYSTASILGDYGTTYSANLCTTSADMWNGFWGSLYYCTVVRDTGTSSPYGGVPLKMTTTAADPQAFGTSDGTWAATCSVNDYVNYDIYVKSSVAGNTQMFMIGFDSSLTQIEYVTMYSNIVTTSWKRFTGRVKFTNTSVTYYGFRIDGNDTVGSNTWFDGLTIKKGNPPTVNYDTNNGGSFLFDGFIGNIDYGKSFVGSGLTAGNYDYTLEAFFNCTDISKLGTTNITANGIIGNRDYGTGFQALNSSGVLQLNIGSRGGGNRTATYSFAANTWYYASFSAKYGVGTQLVVNGVPHSVSSYAFIVGTPSSVTPGNMMIGDFGGRVFPGYIGETKVYNRALTIDEQIFNFNTNRNRYRI